MLRDEPVGDNAQGVEMNKNGLGSIGIIGIGHIGIHYVRHLVKAGADVFVADALEERVVEAVSCGASGADSTADLAGRVDKIILALPEPTVVRAVLSGEQGVFASARPRTLIIDASTGDPDTARAMYAVAKSRQLDYIETPISGGEPGEGGTAGARTASVTFMVGGDRDAFERARPILNVLGSHSLYLGPSGTGSTVKLLSNHVAGLVNLVASETCALGAAAGLGFETLLDVFSRTDANTYMMLQYAADRVRSGDFEAGFSVDLMHKDHRLAGELADQLGVPMPLNTLALKLYQRIRDQGLGHRDVTQSYPSYVSMTSES